METNFDGCRWDEVWVELLAGVREAEICFESLKRSS
jgi:hypothetical protein